MATPAPTGKPEQQGRGFGRGGRDDRDKKGGPKGGKFIKGIHVKSYLRKR